MTRLMIAAVLAALAAADADAGCRRGKRRGGCQAQTAVTGCQSGGAAPVQVQAVTVAVQSTPAVTCGGGTCVVR